MSEIKCIFAIGRTCTDTFNTESITPLTWVQGLIYASCTAPVMLLIGSACSSWTPPPAPSTASLVAHAAIRIPHANNFTPLQGDKFLQYRKLKRRERRAPTAGGFMERELKRDAGWACRMPYAGCGKRATGRDIRAGPPRPSKPIPIRCS